MNDISDLSSAIVIKSDQLNAEDFLGLGSMDIVVTKVDFKRGQQQPLWLHSEGRQPFKPCMTMIKALMEIWEPDGRKWIGRTLTLYRREDVNFGKQKNIGGVRISHLSHMKQPVIKMMLTARRGVKEEWTFYEWQPQDHTAIVNQYTNTPQDQQPALWASLTNQQQEAINQAFKGAK